MSNLSRKNGFNFCNFGYLSGKDTIHSTARKYRKDFVMADSQSSDLVSETEMVLDTESYGLLLDKIKSSMYINVNKNSRLAERMCILLDDCRNCVEQTFHIITFLLDDHNVKMGEVCDYIENVECILQTLSNFLKSTIESVAVTCNMVNTFPTYIGNIILRVFSHCKDSEHIYGSHLSSAMKQLKELFRSCHELQLTYLMILEKHLLFDLTVKEEQDILLRTFKINLEIGEIVQTLDVKSVAEQWKAYTALCEKYSIFVQDKNIYNECTKCLASTIDSSLRKVLEMADEDKIIIRSLKVACFSLKILLKISNIFKGAVGNDYDHITSLLINIYLYTSNYQELILKKSPEFSRLVYGHLTTPSEALVSQIVNEQKFVKNVLSTNIYESKDPKLLGYVLLLISIMKALQTQKVVPSGIKNEFFNHLYLAIQKCHIWFNIGLKFESINREVQLGLYEHLLVHTVAFAATMTCQEYKKLEKSLFEAIMGADYYCAVFSSNLWVSLCRMNKCLQMNTLQNLLNAYQTLGAHTAFTGSPQKINLSYTIEKIFETLGHSEKCTIYKQFSLNEEKNIGLWCALKIKNLPNNLQGHPELMTYVFSTLDRNKSDVEKLINCMNLLSTFVDNPRIDDTLFKAWRKLCTNCSPMNIQKVLTTDSLHYYVYIESLIHLTHIYRKYFEKNTILVIKIINIISSILQLGNAEIIVLMFETFCELLICQNEYKYTNIDEYLINILKICIEADQNNIFAIFMSNEDVNNFVTPILNKEPSLKEIKKNFNEYKTQHQGIEWKSTLEISSEYTFEHKCIENISYSSKSTEIREAKRNFDIDIDSLFDEEPVVKKAKLGADIENVISSLETNAQQLLQIKENIQSDELQNRIKNVCKMLQNILFYHK